MVWLVSGTYKVVVPLDDLQEKGWSVLHRFGEDLEEVALVVEIHQDFQFLERCTWHFNWTKERSCKSSTRLIISPAQTHLQNIQVLLHLDLGSFKLLPKALIVCVGRRKEFHPPGAEVYNLFYSDEKKWVLKINFETQDQEFSANGKKWTLPWCRTLTASMIFDVLSAMCCTPGPPL